MPEGSFTVFLGLRLVLGLAIFQKGKFRSRPQSSVSLSSSVSYSSSFISMKYTESFSKLDLTEKFSLAVFHFRGKIESWVDRVLGYRNISSAVFDFSTAHNAKTFGATRGLRGENFRTWIPPTALSGRAFFGIS